MRPLLVLATVASLAAATPAAAAPRVVTRTVSAAAPRVPAVPMALPGEAVSAAVDADRSTWLVGSRATRAAAVLAARAGAGRVAPGTWVVPRAAARAFAGALRARGLLTFAEPNRLSALRQAPPRAVPDDPYSAQVPWRDAAVDPALAPPAVTPDSPVLALIDAKADVSHPEFSSGNLVSLQGQSVGIDHGTATAAVAAAPVNGIGMVGVWPGMRAINVPLPNDEIPCSESVRGIDRAVAAGAAVINMSYGSREFCQAEYNALQRATRRGVTLVAAAGNEFDQGNPREFPASLPHVLTVGASTPSDEPAFFSNTNAALDVVAPGVGIVTAVPVALDRGDGQQDGYAIVNGTSFSAPMVAAAAAWVRAARPDLTVDQVAQVIRLSARDIHNPGYDTATGFGALDLGAALARTPPGIRPGGAPVADPLEPNEDIGFVDGRAFGERTRPVFSGRKRTIEALLDLFEDPRDVYRVRVPARRTVRVRMAPTIGNPDLEVYSPSASNVGQARHRVGRSRRQRQLADTVRFRNRSRRARTYYVNVHIRPGQRVIDAAYALTVR